MVGVTPDPDVFGTTSFDDTISDGDGGTDTASVDVTGGGSRRAHAVCERRHRCACRHLHPGAARGRRRRLTPGRLPGRDGERRSRPGLDRHRLRRKRRHAAGGRERAIPGQPERGGDFGGHRKRHTRRRGGLVLSGEPPSLSRHAASSGPEPGHDADTRIAVVRNRRAVSDSESMLPIERISATAVRPSRRRIGETGGATDQYRCAPGAAPVRAGRYAGGRARWSGTRPYPSASVRWGATRER